MSLVQIIFASYREVTFFVKSVNVQLVTLPSHDQFQCQI